MKPKKLKKKLTLNKKNIASFSTSDMNVVKGGTKVTVVNCISLRLTCNDTIVACCV